MSYEPDRLTCCLEVGKFVRSAGYACEVLDRLALGLDELGAMAEAAARIQTRIASAIRVIAIEENRLAARRGGE